MAERMHAIILILEFCPCLSPERRNNKEQKPELMIWNDREINPEPRILAEAPEKPCVIKIPGCLSVVIIVRIHMIA